MEDKIFNYAINDGFLWSEVNLKGEKKFYIEGYASTIDEDKSGEILDITAQQDIHNQIQAENITMDIEHEEWYDDNGKLLARPKNEKIPVAKIVSSELRPRGVWVKAEINTNLKSFSQIWGSIKDGFLKAFSVAFYPVQKSGGIIKHLNLINVTLTGSPVNPHATFSACMKSASAWMDSIEVKADLKPSVDGPAVAGVETPDAVTPKHPKMTEVKAELCCEKCDKEFESKEELDNHKCNAKIKSMEDIKMTEEIKTEIIAAEVKAEPVVDIQAEVKAMKDAHEAELKALNEEVATLKAELEKPVMKAIVETTIPKETPTVQIVSPLRLVR